MVAHKKSIKGIRPALSDPAREVAVFLGFQREFAQMTLLFVAQNQGNVVLAGRPDAEVGASRGLRLRAYGLATMDRTARNRILLIHDDRATCPRTWRAPRLHFLAGGARSGNRFCLQKRK